jgi:hypothetical protein
MNESLHLAAREFDSDTAAQLSSLSIGIAHTQSSSPKPRNRRAPHTPGSGASAAANGIAGGSRYPDTPASARAVRGGGDLGADDAEGDEIDRARYLARLNSFMQHRDSDSNDDDEDDDIGDDGLGDGDGSPRLRGRAIPVGDIGFDEDEDEVDGMFDLDEAEVLDYAGASGGMEEVDGRLQGGGGGGGEGGEAYLRTGAGEEVDEYGEDDERFAEGNDEYELGGGGVGVEGGRQVGAG